MKTAKTSAGGLRLTAETPVDHFVMNEVRATLTRCFSNPTTLWVPKEDVERVEGMITHLTKA